MNTFYAQSSKCGLWVSSTGITRKLISNVDSQIPTSAADSEFALGPTYTCHTHLLKSQCASLQKELSNLRLWSCSVYMGWNGLGCSRTWVLPSYPPRPCTPHSSMLPRSVTVSLLWDSCSSSASDSESCRDNLLLFKLPTRRMLDKEPPFFTWKLRVPLIWSRREPPILIFLLGTVLKE